MNLNRNKSTAVATAGLLLAALTMCPQSAVSAENSAKEKARTSPPAAPSAAKEPAPVAPFGTVVNQGTAAFPQGVPVPEAGALKGAPALRFEGADNWDFEDGLDGWEQQKDSTAFLHQPTCGDNVMASRVLRMQLGGNYWDVPYPIGHHGQHWIGTFESRPNTQTPFGQVQGDKPTGYLVSRAFKISADRRFISFLISGGDDIARERFELLVRPLPGSAPIRSQYPPIDLSDGQYFIVDAVTGHNSERFRRERFDAKGAFDITARLRILDDSSGPWGHINIDDIRFSPEDPAADFAEMVLNGRTIKIDADAPVWGLADTHAHPMAHLGFGGKLYWGDNDGELLRALPGCEPSHGINGYGPQDIASLVSGGLIFGSRFGPITEGLIRQFAIHGIEPAPTESGHRTHGWPEFDGWPNFFSRAHQHMHEQWIRRAYEGGLRLMVAHAVNTEALAMLNPADGIPWTDKASYDLQIDRMKSFVAAHSDYMAIAKTPAEARAIIRADKLAIVLGIEVDSLGGFGNEPDCTDRDVAQEIDRLNKMGVRHVFPIHLADSAFGGCSIYNDIFEVNHRVLRGAYHATRHDDEARSANFWGVQFQLFRELPSDPSWWHDLIGQLDWGHTNVVRWPVGRADARDVPLRQIVSEIADRTARASSSAPALNELGLTARGRACIAHLMRRGMIIDVDHMSLRATRDTLGLAESRVQGDERGYPLCSGHSSFGSLAWRVGETDAIDKLQHESDKLDEFVDRIRELGGMVNPITTERDVRGFGDDVPDDCPGSSKSFAQEYLYAVAHMGDKGVGIGTDMAMLGAMAPRFGTYAGRIVQKDRHRVAARAQALHQSNGVRYENRLQDYHAYHFDGDGYTDDQKDIWLGVTLGRSDHTIEGIIGAPDLGLRTIGNADFIKDIAKGVRAAVTGRPEDSLAPANSSSNNVAGLYNFGAVEHGAFRAYRGTDPATIIDLDIREYVKRFATICDQARAMDGDNPPLRRCVAGNRYFDFNLDGMAHYGMIPDMLQDLRNDGIRPPQMAPLFNSAEQYIRMWEKCERIRNAN